MIGGRGLACVHFTVPLNPHIRACATPKPHGTLLDGCAVSEMASLAISAWSSVHLAFHIAHRIHLLHLSMKLRTTSTSEVSDQSGVTGLVRHHFALFT